MLPFAMLCRLCSFEYNMQLNCIRLHCVNFTTYNDFKHSLTTSVLIKFCKLFLCNAYCCSSINVSQCTVFLYCNVSGLMVLL